MGRWKNECDRWDVQGWEKNKVTIESGLHLLLEVCTFLKFWSSQQYECKECNWKTTMNNKGKESVKEWAQTKVGGGSEIAENNRNRRGVEKSRKRNVEYSTIGCKIATAFIIIFGMCKRQGI